MGPLGDNWHPLHAPDDDFVQESQSLCTECGDFYDGPYEEHAREHAS